jgi:hypothetical protein
LIHAMQDCKDRPLIFIGHCFGGLVIQKVRDFQYTIHIFSCKRQTLTLHTSGLVDSTIGIIFLGTPHAGTVTFTSSGVSTKDILTVIAMHSELRREPKVLSELESEYGTLLEVSQDFLDLCRSSRGHSLRVINFFEQRASKVGKQIGRDDLQVLTYKILLCRTK